MIPDFLEPGRLWLLLVVALLVWPARKLLDERAAALAAFHRHEQEKGG